MIKKLTNTLNDITFVKVSVRWLCIIKSIQVVKSPSPIVSKGFSGTMEMQSMATRENKVVPITVLIKDHSHFWHNDWHRNILVNVECVSNILQYAVIVCSLPTALVWCILSSISHWRVVLLWPGSIFNVFCVCWQMACSN